MNKLIKQFTYLFTRSFEIIKNTGIKSFIKKMVIYTFSSKKIDLDTFVINKDDNLDDFFVKFGTDKGSLDGKKTYDTLYKNSNKKEFKNYLDWINRKNPKNYEYQLGHNSAPIYESFFLNRRLEKVKILELGVANGHSIASWHHYFLNATIYGIDNKEPYKFFYESKRVKYAQVDIFNKKKIKNFIKKNGNFDFIIDDSVHNEYGILTNLINFYPALNSKGIYFVEDFRGIDKAKELNVQHNLQNNGKWMVGDPITIKGIFDNINKKKMFEHLMLKKDILEYIIENTSKAEIIYQDHPWGAIGVLQKK